MIGFFYFPYHNTGQAFVDWSVYFLSGQTEYTNWLGQTSTVEASENIGLQRNFHSHHCGLELYLHDINDDGKISNLESRYADRYQAIQIKIAPSIIVDLRCQDPGDRKLKYQKYYEHQKKVFSDLQKNKHKLIFIEFDRKDFLNIFYNNRYPVSFKDSNMEIKKTDLLSTWEEQFFPDTHENFQCHNIWDAREKYAVITKPYDSYDPNLYAETIDKKLPHLYYTTDDIWNDFHHVVLEILDFLGLDLVQSRLQSWTHTYWNWRQVHDQFFSRNYYRILEAIVQGHDMSLERYNLNFEQEILIQAGLMRIHNLNLKTFQLVEFPKNTKDLHLLLEPNIHDLGQYF